MLTKNVFEKPRIEKKKSEIKRKYRKFMVMLVARCVSLTYAQMVLWMIRMLWMIITLFDLIA